MKFKPEDFSTKSLEDCDCIFTDDCSCDRFKPEEMADKANAKLQEWLKNAVLVNVTCDVDPMITDSTWITRCDQAISLSPEFTSAKIMSQEEFKEYLKRRHK